MATLDPKLWRPAADLNAKTFTNAIIPLSDLFRAGIARRENVITQREFVNCRLEGPAVFFALGAVQLDFCNLGEDEGDIRNLLLKPVGARVNGAIPFGDCRFDACSFFAVGFTGPDAFLNQFMTLQPQRVS